MCASSEAHRLADSDVHRGAVEQRRIVSPVLWCKRLLRFGLRCHESHRWSRGRLADSFDVTEIILVALDERAHELWRDQPDRMSELAELARHPVSAGTGLHRHSAGVKRGEEFDQLLAGELPTKHGFARLVPPIHV